MGSTKKPTRRTTSFSFSVSFFLNKSFSLFFFLAWCARAWRNGEGPWLLTRILLIAEYVGVTKSNRWLGGKHEDFLPLLNAATWLSITSLLLFSYILEVISFWLDGRMVFSGRWLYLGLSINTTKVRVETIPAFDGALLANNGGPWQKPKSS